MRSQKSEFEKYPGLYKVHGFSVCSSSSSTTIMSDFGDIQNWSDNCLVDNNDNPDALFKAKNAEKRWRRLVCVEKRQKAEEVEEHWKVAEAEECRKVAEARCKAEEEAKRKAAEEAAKKRVSVSTFSDKQCYCPVGQGSPGRAGHWS